MDTHGQSDGHGQPHGNGQPHGTAAVDELEPIELEEWGDDGGGAAPARSKIRALGPDAPEAEDKWKRPTTTGCGGATRVRSFHGKYSDEGLRFLDSAINHWLDDHNDVEVKFVTSTVMQFEGKIREPALVLNVWY